MSVDSQARGRSMLKSPGVEFARASLEMDVWKEVLKTMAISDAANQTAISTTFEVLASSIISGVIIIDLQFQRFQKKRKSTV